MPRILFVNNLGGGFADYLDVPEGTGIQELFDQKLPHERADDFLIRVNRQPVPKDHVLQDGDRVTMTPTKIQGARPGSPPPWGPEGLADARRLRRVRHEGPTS